MVPCDTQRAFALSQRSDSSFHSQILPRERGLQYQSRASGSPNCPLHVVARFSFGERSDAYSDESRPAGTYQGACCCTEDAGCTITEHPWNQWDMKRHPECQSDAETKNDTWAIERPRRCAAYATP